MDLWGEKRKEKKGKEKAGKRNREGEREREIKKEEERGAEEEEKDRHLESKSLVRNFRRHLKKANVGCRLGPTVASVFGRESCPIS